MESPWFIRRQPQQHARVRLLCFPYAGGGASVFRDWPALLAPAVEVVAVQLPGRETRLRERAIDDMAEVADHLWRAIAPYLDKPVAIYGHSMGALLAYELSHRLEKFAPGSLTKLLISARRSPRQQEPESPLHILDDDAFVNEIQKRYGGIPAEVLRHRELLELLLPALRADMRALESYQYLSRPPLHCPIVAIAGTDDARASASMMAGWQVETAGPFSAHVVPGGHFFLQSARAELGRILLGELQPAHAGAVTCANSLSAR